MHSKCKIASHGPGQYLLTGSQNLLLMEKVTESLAGRAAMLRLLPLSWHEATSSWSLPESTDASEPLPERRPAYGELWESGA